MVSMVFMDNVFSQDEYGNQLWFIGIYQDGFQTYYFDDDDYSEDMNVSVRNYLWNDFIFNIVTYVNSTVIEENDGIVDLYQGVGIQVYDENEELIYANGIIPDPEILYDPDPIEIIHWNTEDIEIEIYKTINYVNVTLWHNYEMTGDTGDYVLTESWKFNLLADNYGYTPPPEDETMFFDLYFALFILCLFVCPLSVVGTIKMRNPKLLRITAFSLVGLVVFFFLLMNVNPFG